MSNKIPCISPIHNYTKKCILEDKLNIMDKKIRKDNELELQYNEIEMLKNTIKELTLGDNTIISVIKQSGVYDNKELLEEINRKEGIIRDKNKRIKELIKLIRIKNKRIRDLQNI
jgi:hypothetical protein